MKQQNFVAKYARQFNKAVVETDRKKTAKKGALKGSKNVRARLKAGILD